MRPDSFLSIRGLSKSYIQQHWWASERIGSPVIQRVTIDLEQGRTLGLVGASGSGKSTLARCLALFEPPTGGEIWLEGRNLWASSRRERCAMRNTVQLIFQEPAASLNPRFTAGQVIAEPLVIQRRGTERTRERRVCELMEIVGLPAEGIRKPALEWSGGERQRLAIARALVAEPSLLILDESLSSLDLSVRAQIANLLLDLKELCGLTYILISHEFPLVAGLSDEIAVMDEGIIVEHAPVAQLLANPQHVCTRNLLSATYALSGNGTWA
jgi:ABC-type glutathione transport system ATPase component